MKDSADKGRGFWSEIRRRGIVHVTGLYLVAAWLIVQVADTLAQGPVPMPAEALRHIWFALGLIFPIALVFGWRYDFTREGIVRTVPHTGGREDRPLRPIDHSIIAGLSLVVAGVLGLTTMEIVEAIEHDRLRAGVGVEEATRPAPVNSIAVLPFTVCSGQEADQILAAGLAAEVIDQLASVGTFKVIARASSFTIAGFGLSLRQVAQPLRVKYLLTGELCRQGDRLMLRVELVDDEGYVVWSEAYEQASDRWGRIPVTLAKQVTQGVSGALGHGFEGKPAAPVNRLAYEQLVIGREYAEQDRFDRARAAFEKALEHEPDYAEAVWELSRLVEWEALSSGDLTLDYLGEAWPLGERALNMARRRIEDGSADFETYGFLGWILFEIGKWEEKLIRRRAGELDEAELKSRLDAANARVEEAEGYVRMALALNPSHIDHYLLLGYVVERQGVHRRNEALEIFEEAYNADPFNPRVNRQVAKRWAARGRYRQAMELLERFEVLPEVPPAVRFVQLEIRKLQTYWDEKCELLLAMLRDEPEAFEHAGNYGHLVWFASELAELGLLEAARAWYERVEQIPAEGWAAVLRGWSVNEYLYKVGVKDDDLEADLAAIAGMTDEEILDSDMEGAYVLAEAGDYDRAIRLAESQQMMRLDSTFWVERRPAPRLLLASLYQADGRSADADALLRDIVGDLEREYEVGIRHPQTLEFLATAYAMQGRDDEALDMYRKAVDYHLRRRDLPDWPPPVSPWARLRDDPRFAMQWDRMQADLLQQGERIRMMLARYDIDELLGPTVALAENRAAESDGEN